MPGTFSPPPQVSDPDMHQDTCVMHVPWCMPGSLTSGFLYSRWRGKRSRNSQRMRNPQFYVSGKRPMVDHYDFTTWRRFPCYWPFVAGIHRSTVDSPHKGTSYTGLWCCFDVCLDMILSQQSSGRFFRRYDAHVMSLQCVCGKFGMGKSLWTYLTYWSETLLINKDHYVVQFQVSKSWQFQPKI